MGILDLLASIPTNANLRLKLTEREGKIAGLEKENMALKEEKAKLQAELTQANEEIKALTAKIETRGRNRPRIAEGTDYDPFNPGDPNGWMER